MNIIKQHITNKNNYTPASRGAKEISTIVVHTNNGPAATLNGVKNNFNWWQNNDRGVSAHYEVYRDGRIIEFVDPKNIGHHAGDWRWNQWSIGIEFEDAGRPHDPAVYTPVQLENGAKLIEYLSRKYAIVLKTLPEGGIIPHNQTASTGCPGSLHWIAMRERAKELREERAEEAKRRAEEQKRKEEERKRIQEEQQRLVEERQRLEREIEENSKKIDDQTPSSEDTGPNTGSQSVASEYTQQYVNTKGIKLFMSWYKGQVDRIPNKVVRSFLKYDIFTFVLPGLSGISGYLLGLELESELYAQAAATAGVILGLVVKVFLTTYDKNEDGRLDKGEISYNE